MTKQILLHAELSSPECQELALKLGFTQYPRARPYLQHIVSKCGDSRRRIDFLWLFSEVIRLASLAPSAWNIQSIIDEFVNDANNRYFVNAIPSASREHVTNTVFLILGLWSMMGMSFEPNADHSWPVIRAFNARVNCQLPTIEPLKRSLQQLVEGSGFIPGPAIARTMPDNIGSTIDPNTFYPMSSQSIPARALNLSKLSTLAGVHIHWTDNISRHLLLSHHGGTLYIELYAYPCTLDHTCRANTFREQTGVPITYLNEISRSYSTLFNPVDVSRAHRWLNRLGAWRWVCWCLACTSYRLRRQEFRCLTSDEYVVKDMFYDPSLERLSNAPRTDWSQGTYPNLWSRIVELESSLQGAKPWSFWVLFRDRREKLPFWTFLFATFILILTSFQVVIGIVQAVSGFRN